MNAESAYECATCGEIFADIEDAANCHNTSFHYVFFCGECWGQLECQARGRAVLPGGTE